MAPAPRARTCVTKAVILAGGPGNMLFIAANYYPKLLFPVANEPLLAHLMSLLAQQGIARAAIVCSRPSDRETLIAARQRLHLPAGRLTVLLDEGANGTAGCLRSARDFVDGDPFLLMDSGVYPTSLDLARLQAHHDQRRASITVVLTRQPDGSAGPHEDVQLTQDGRIVTIGVPYGRAAQRTSVRSAGMYLVGPGLLDCVPPSGHLDLKERWLHELHRQGREVHGFITEQPVQRLDSLSHYLRLNQALLGDGPGRNGSASGHHQSSPAVWADAGARVSALASLSGPIRIAEGCRVDAGARIEGPASLGPGCHVRENAVVRRAILWSDVEIGSGASIHDSVVASRCRVPANARVSHAFVLDEPARDGRSRHPAHPPRATATILHRNGRLRAAGRHRPADRAYAVSKRVVDILLSSVLLIALVPVLCLIAVAIKLESRGPILYGSKRCGRLGRPFTMYKFRTMRRDAHGMAAVLRDRTDVDGPMFKMRKDPRVTRVGRVLRRSSLDELPQLFNVLCGTMSLVGPRPLAMEEMSCSPSWRDCRLSVKPGITGQWQVSGRSDVGFRGWIEHDTHYVKHRSLWLDTKILLKTVGAVIGSRGAV